MRMNKYFGDKKFYRMVLLIALPIILQNVVTNFVNMLDNIMVGQLGTLDMSGVSIANQLLNIFNLAIFGSVTAGSIFSSQYMGKKDMEGVKNCFKAKLYLTTISTIVGVFIFLLFGQQLILLYMDENMNVASDISYTLQSSFSYLQIMCIGLLPFALSQSIGSTIRESGNTVLPMFASWTAVAINFIGNIVLIFGYLGFPRLGVLGAAIATVLSRFVELGVTWFGAKRDFKKYPFFSHVFETLLIPRDLAKQIIGKGSPLLVNELLWSIGNAAIAQCYSTRGLETVAAFNIANTIQNIFFTVVIGMGSAISIIVGQKLGANQIEEAIDEDRKIIVLAIILCSIVGLSLFFTASIFPNLYQTDIGVKNLATQLLRIIGLSLPIHAIYNCAYFTLRSGGKTWITFFFDAGSTMLVSFPTAFVLSRFTSFNVIEMFLVIVVIDIMKAILGLILVNKRVWVNNLTISTKQ